MKTLVILSIRFYQRYLSFVIKNILGVRASCRYPLSCSAYAVRQIEREGIIKGIGMAWMRVLSCNSFINTYGKYI